MEPIVNNRVVEPSHTVSEDIYLLSMSAVGDIAKAIYVSIFALVNEPRQVKNVKVHRARIVTDDRRRSMEKDFIGKVRFLEARCGNHLLENYCTDKVTGINNFVFYPTAFINEHCANKVNSAKALAETFEQHGVATSYMELGMALNLIAHQYQASAMAGDFHQHRMELLDNIKQQVQDNFPELMIEEHRMIVDGPIFYKLRKCPGNVEKDNVSTEDEDE